MGKIPGNENFADVKRDYGQARSKEVTFTVDQWSGTGAYPLSAFYSAGNARMLWILVDASGNYEKSNIQVVLKDDSGLISSIVLSGQADTSETQSGDPSDFTLAFSITGKILPHTFAIENQSQRGDLPITLLFNY